MELIDISVRIRSGMVTYPGDPRVSVERVVDEAAHQALLRARVVAVEGLDLRLQPGRYELICLPLRVVGADGAPARAVLVRR